MKNNESLDILLRAYIGERDTFYDDVTDSEGVCRSADDAAELARMDVIIDNAQAALARLKLTGAIGAEKAGGVA